MVHLNIRRQTFASLLRTIHEVLVLVLGVLLKNHTRISCCFDWKALKKLMVLFENTRIRFFFFVRRCLTPMYHILDTQYES